MKIDKSRFLLLTTTLTTTVALAVVSTTACTTTTTNTDAGDNTPTDSGTNYYDGSNTGDGSTSDAGACLGNSGAAPTCEPSETDAGASPYGDAGDAGSSSSVKCSTECNAANMIFKTQVASWVSACVDKVPSPTAEACAAELEPCIKTALGKACDDDTAAEYCSDLLPSCVSEGGYDAGPDGGAGLTQANCVAVVKAMSGEGRAALTSCVASASTCLDCFDQVKQGALQ